MEVFYHSIKKLKETSKTKQVLGKVIVSIYKLFITKKLN